MLSGFNNENIAQRFIHAFNEPSPAATPATSNGLARQALRLLGLWQPPASWERQRRAS